MRYFILNMLSLLLCYPVYSQSFDLLVNKPGVSFRGLDTHEEHTVWVSGSEGTVGRSADGGDTWTWVSPQGYEAFDFRDIEAFSAEQAVIVSAGSPAVILSTEDGGTTWVEVYRNDDSRIFLNGMDFQGTVGYILGDPIAGQFQLLKSTDEGRTWDDVSEKSRLSAKSGEVAFAASGSSLQLIGDALYIGSGGSVARLFKTELEGEAPFKGLNVPMRSGIESTGIFSIDFFNAHIGVVVGGDYKNDEDNHHNIWLTENGGLSWRQPEQPVSGYRSCVKYISDELLVATGTSGTDISADGGNTWKLISKKSFNVIATTNKGHVYLAGSQGDIVRLEMANPIPR